MTVPKWLIPVISIVAALAVGISLAFVGANYASKAVVDTTATTTTVPVLGPSATGLTPAQFGTLTTTDRPKASKTVGSQNIVEPGARRSSTSVQQAVNSLVTPVTGTPTPAPTPTPTPTPVATALPNAGSVGVVPYDNDPCSTTGTPAPAGCPTGTLHGAIFADSIPPALDFSINPFTAPCPTTSTPTGNVFGDGHAVVITVPILLRPTVPASFSIHSSSNLPTGAQITLDAHGIPTEASTVGPWNDALAHGQPLPPLESCIQAQGLAGQLIHVWITATTADGQTVAHDLVFQSDGTPTLPEVQIDTFVSHDYFVAYSETSPTIGLSISGYDITTAPGSTCADASHLTRILSTYARDGGFETTPGVPTQIMPRDFTVREAVGFVVQPGSVTLVCAGWHHGREVPSFDRTTPYRVSSSIVRAPDAVVPFLTAFNIQLGTRQDGTPDEPRDVSIAGSTIEGIACGSADIAADGLPLIGHRSNPEERFCSVPLSQLDSATDDPTLRGDLVVTSTVISYGNRTSVGQFTVLPSTTICVDCDVQPQDTFEVALPGLNGHSAGTVWINRGFEKIGHSGLRTWIVNPQYSTTAEVASLPGAPQLNTDEGITLDPTRSTPTQETGRFNLLVDQNATYTVRLSSLDGSAPCVLAHGLTSVTGHFTGSVATPIYFPGLCFNTIYLASVELTSPNGTTQWGWHSGNNHWPRYLLITPKQRVQATVVLTVHTTHTHQVADGLGVTFDGHLLDGTGSGFATCAATATQTFNEGTIDISASPTLHLDYQLRPGDQSVTGGVTSCTFTAGTASPAVSADVAINLATILAHPHGVHYTSGPLDVLITLTPAS